MPETTLTKISEHVYWMSPGKPDRPSLGAVVGTDFTLMLDSGASDAHTRLFVDALKAEGVAAPRYVVLTHWHWDHVFGAAEIGVPVIAHETTAAQLAVLANYDWSDSSLDARVTTGEEIIACANDIKVELPQPRTVRIKQPEIVLRDSLELRLGGVTVKIQHVGGDHAADSCVMHIMSDRVLFLGDCLYDAIYTPVRHFTTTRLFPLIDTILSFDAEHFIEGHTDTVMPRSEVEALTSKMRLAGRLVDQIGTDESAVMAAAQAETGQTPDEDTTDFIRAFIAGRNLG